MSICSSLRIAAAAVSAIVLAVPVVAAQTSFMPDGSAVGVTRYELQRGLLEIDEQRRRLETSLEPVDSVLRIMSHDSAQILALRRLPSVQQDLARVVSRMRELRVLPESLGAATRFIEAVNAVTRRFTAGEDSLGSRVLSTAAARDYLARSPHAAVVPLETDLPPRNTAIWEKIRQSDYGKRPLPRITLQDMANFRLAVSDSGFEAYRTALLGALTARMTDIRQTRDTARAEIQRLRNKAAELAHAIGARDDSISRAETHAINVGLPVFAVVFITLLFAPRVYRNNPELQQWFFTSGVLLEITTLVLIVSGLLVLALAGKLSEAVIGTVLGSVFGYSIGRGAARRLDAPEPAATEVTRINVPVVATSRRA